MAHLLLKNLQKEYGANIIPVKNISLEVNDGEFLTLLGPSGCGKSTLLRLIAGLEQPSQGEIKIGDRLVNNLTPGERNIAMVFQSYALYPHFTVAQNIANALKLRKVPKDVIQTRVIEVATKLGLTNLLDRKPAQLSGGQRQRVALARALVREPDLFLLDEPLSNLDALLREQVRAELKQLFKSQNKPVVYVTHDQVEAMSLSSKVAVLYNGVIQQLDKPSAIYQFPANYFVASFVGSPQMNLLTLKCEGERAFLGKYSLKLPPVHIPKSQIFLGVRPEDIKLATSETKTNLIEATVYLTEELGKENLLSLKVYESDITIKVLMTNAQSYEGKTLTLTIPEHLTHWFDADTGMRI